MEYAGIYIYMYMVPFPIDGPIDFLVFIFIGLSSTERQTCLNYYRAEGHLKKLYVRYVNKYVMGV